MDDWRRGAWAALGAALMAVGATSGAAFYTARANAVVPGHNGVLVVAHVNYAAPFLIACYSITFAGFFFIFWSLSGRWLPGISKSETDREALHRLVSLAVQQSSLLRSGVPSAPALERFSEWVTVVYKMLTDALGSGEADRYRSPAGLSIEWNYPPEQDLSYRHQRLSDLLTRLHSTPTRHFDYRKWRAALESYP